MERFEASMTPKESKDFSQLIQITKEELTDVRLRGHFFPPKTEQVVSAIRFGEGKGEFTLEEIGTNEEELKQLLVKAGFPEEHYSRLAYKPQEKVPTLPPRVRTPKNSETEEFKPASSRDNMIDEQEHFDGAYITSYFDGLEQMVTGHQTKGANELGSTSQMNYGRNEKVENLFREMIKGKDVVDLGCGVCASGYNISDHCEAKSYVGVEKFFSKDAEAEIKKLAKFDDSTPFQIVPEDMVRFARELPRDSVGVVFLVGVDKNILPSDYDWEDMMKGIHSALKKDGYLIMGGGGMKPWRIIFKYFERKDEKLDAIVTDNYERMDLPSIYIKKI
jgi:hypothetical protein